MLRYFIRCLGLRYLPISICPVVFGAASATYHGGFDFMRSLLCLFFAMAAQMTGNVARHYFMIKEGKDKSTADPDLYMLDTNIRAREFISAALTAMLIVVITLALALMAQSTVWILVAGAAIFAVAYCYQAGPYPLGRRGWGELVYFLLYGPVAVIGTAFINVQDGLGSHIFQTWQFIEIVAMSCISGLCVVAVLLAREYRTLPYDIAVRRRTLAVTLGRNTVAWMFLLIGFLIFGLYYYMTRYQQTGLVSGTPVPLSTIWWVPMTYLVLQIVIFILMRVLPEGKSYVPERLAMLNMCILAAMVAVLSTSFGEPEQVMIHYFC